MELRFPSNNYIESLIFFKVNKKHFPFLLLIILSKLCIGQQEPYIPLKIEDAITIDGKLDEPEWKQAVLENNFMQSDPTPGGDPTEKTDFRIMYNNEYMYVGVHAYDSFPSKIIQIGLERDYNLGCDDGTA